MKSIRRFRDPLKLSIVFSKPTFENRDSIYGCREWLLMQLNETLFPSIIIVLSDRYEVLLRASEVDD
jgi:hypothetical protein